MLTIHHKNTTTGKQLLLNYCFSHHESTLLLCPTSHGAFINHNKATPNAVIKWSQTNANEINRLKNMTLEDGVYKLKWTVLSFDVIATRDIKQDEEIFIDYGSLWEHAWTRHVHNWQESTKTKPSPSYMYPNELNARLNHGHIIRTVY